MRKHCGSNKFKNENMEPLTLINHIILGGILGMLGQIIRVLVGLRKMAKRNEEYEASRMFISIVIGFTAGALGIIMLHFQKQLAKTISAKDIILLISTGYAGVDFIEGFFRTMIKKTISIEDSTSSTQTNNGQQRPPTNQNKVPATFTFNGNGQSVQIKYGQNANTSAISAYALEVIKDILKASGNYSARITSTARTPSDQARAMYNNLIGDPENIQKQKKLYGPNGDQVIMVFEAAQKAGKNRMDTLAVMEAKIWELGPGKVSRHCADFTKLVVVDIAPSSIDNHDQFKLKVNQDERVSRFFCPPKDPAFHLEIPTVVVEVEEELHLPMV